SSWNTRRRQLGWSWVRPRNGGLVCAFQNGAGVSTCRPKTLPLRRTEEQNAMLPIS
ncbi:uncharacterized protein METZ01_LOCUS498565, partial [marine metagenome]